MKLRTIFELATRSDNELHLIAREASQELARSKAGSPDRRNALGTIENVNRVMRSRMPRP